MLNPQQTAAVRYIDGPLLVLAGAGSGKTRVITQKIAYLIQECGYAAHSVCAVTFTNKAANEMLARVSQSLPAAKKRGLKIATFHTLGLHLIKRELAHCTLKKGFSIFDSEDCQQLIRQFLPANRASERDYIQQMQQQISHWKNDLIEPQTLHIDADTLPLVQEAALLYPRYQEALEAYNAVDFDDLIRIPVQLLQNNSTVREQWQNRIRHLLIDEYQDTNMSQYLFMQLLTGMRAQFTVVGDDDQSIYAWRGARTENLAILQREYPQLKVIKLEQNYRSTGNILHSANSLIANNPHLDLLEKKLWSELGPGDKIRIISCKNEQDEAEQVVADMISHKLRHGRRFGEYAILYRGNHQARVFEKALRDQNISYRISGGQSWFARQEVKDVFAYLRLLCNETDDAAFLRVINTPRRGIGESSLASLGHYAQQAGKSLFQCADHLALAEHLTDKPRFALQTFKTWLTQYKQRLTHSGSDVEILRELVDESGYEAYLYEQTDSPMKAQKRMENVWELLAWVGRLLDKKADQQLADVVNKLILIDILEQSNEADEDSVQLLTLHAAKGLEFPHVYLVGMEEELLPHRASCEDHQIEEERRLAYVGITRAQRHLCMTLAKQRKRAGEQQLCQPSRFLDELPEACIEWFGKSQESSEAQVKEIAQAHMQGLRKLLKMDV